jgi:hypothetical protein
MSNRLDVKEAAERCGMPDWQFGRRQQHGWDVLGGKRLPFRVERTGRGPNTKHTFPKVDVDRLARLHAGGGVQEEVGGGGGGGGRDPMQEEVGEYLDDKYFCNKLLTDYLYNYPRTTANWDVVFDARGHYEEPHTRVVIPLGTLDVRKYEGNVRDAEKEVKNLGLKDVSERLGLELASRILPFTTLGPSNRISAILFIEKEGFMPLFRAAKLAEMFDLAIMSSKGLSVTAARRLIDFLCGEFRLPLLVMHDLDQNGFSILGTATRSSRRYQFKNKIKDVRDVGLRVGDVERYGLKPEAAPLRGKYPESGLRRNGATEADIRFLLRRQRVELNTFASDELLTFMQDKFEELSIRKVMPDVDTLALAYRGISARLMMQQKVEEIRPQIITRADALAVPVDLAAQVRKLQHENRALPWDRAVEEIARASLPPDILKAIDLSR